MKVTFLPPCYCRAGKKYKSFPAVLLSNVTKCDKTKIKFHVVLTLCLSAYFMSPCPFTLTLCLSAYFMSPCPFTLTLCLSAYFMSPCPFTLTLCLSAYFMSPCPFTLTLCLSAYFMSPCPFTLTLCLSAYFMSPCPFTLTLCLSVYFMSPCPFTLTKQTLCHRNYSDENPILKTLKIEINFFIFQFVLLALVELFTSLYPCEICYIQY